jgi:hypothetical protein
VNDAGKIVRKLGSTPYAYELVQPDAANGSFVQSVSLAPPSGWSSSTANTNGSVTLTLSLPTGYSLPSNASQGQWDTAYSLRGQWTGAATGLNAATGRASLGLGSAATTDATAYATPAQGAKADAAVQPAALTSALATKADLVDGVLPTSQIPAIALVQYLGSVASQAAMLTLRGQGGDWCLRIDGQAAEWVIVANNGASLSDWVQMPTGSAGVSSINGQTGAVTLGTGDLSESGGNLFFTAARAIGAALTGFTPAAGTVAATDSILQAIQKLATGTFTALSATTSLLLPSTAGTLAGHIYRSGNRLFYRDSSNTEQGILYGGGNLALIADPATARKNLGASSLPVRWAVGRIVSAINVPIGVGSAVAANTIYLTQFIAPQSFTFSKLGARVTTAIAGSNFQLAIYGANSGQLPTGVPIGSTTSISGAAATILSSNATGDLIEGQVYWMACNADAALVFQAIISTSLYQAYTTGASSFNAISGFSTAACFARQIASTFGTWPDLTSLSTTETPLSSQRTALIYFEIGALL